MQFTRNTPIKKRAQTNQTIISKRDKYKVKVHEDSPDKWGLDRVKLFFRGALEFLRSENPDNLYFSQYAHKHNVYDDDVKRFRGMGSDLDLYYKKVMEAEQTNVSYKGARSKINPISAIFYLKSRHKWQETTKVDVQGAVILKTDIESLTK